MLCPFSLRPAPKALNDFTFNNDVSVVPTRLRLVDSISSGVKRLNEDMNAIKNSIDPIVFNYKTRFTMFFPQFIRDLIFEDLCDRMTIGFSNVPGPKTSWVLAGKKCQGIGFIMPAAKSMIGSFSVLSHADVVKMIIMMDKATMESPAIIAEYLKKNLDEILADPDWRNYGK